MLQPKGFLHVIEPHGHMACSVQPAFLVSELVRRQRLLITIALWSAGLLAAAAVLFLLALNFLLRPRLEHSMNRYMTNHRVSLGYAHFELLAGRLILRDLTIFQNAHPSPPIMHLTEARMGVQWLGLLHGQIIADCIIIAPTVHMSAAQLKTEAATTNLKEIKQALLKAPNFTVDRVQMLDLNSTYVDSTRRIEIEHLNLLARDLRHTTYVSGPQEGRGAVRMPELALSVAQAQITDGAIIYRNITPDKGYCAYLNALSLQVFNICNRPRDKPARFKLNGLFMGSGHIYAAGHIQPLQASRNLALFFELSGLQLHSLNPLFRHYGHAEAASGQLSVHSQVYVRANQISGFIEPVITGLKIQAAADKSHPSIVHKVIQSAVKGTAKLLSAPHPAESPRVDLSSSVDVHSGFFGLFVQLAHKAFLEGFEPNFKHAAGQN